MQWVLHMDWIYGGGVDELLALTIALKKVNFILSKGDCTV
jgi:hypothetical protein